MSVTSTLSQSARRSPVRRIVAVTSLIVVGLSATAIGVVAHVPDDQIAPGVHVGSLDLSGKTLPEARTALERWAETQQAAPLDLHFAADSKITQSWKPAAGKLGLGINIQATLDAAGKVGREGALGQVTHWIAGKSLPVAVVPSVDDAKLRVYLTNQIAQDIYRPAKRAQVLTTKGGGFGIRHEINGITLDKDVSAQTVTQAWNRFLNPTAPASSAAQAPAVVSPDSTTVAPTTPAREPAGANNFEAVLTPKLIVPELTAADLEQIDGKLAEFSTYYTGIRNRRDNIVLATRHIDGTLLRAGEIFSYNKTVGPRDSSAGFKQAPQYVHGKHVMGEGGGICQVSSTLFNAALMASLKIVERQNHSMPVGYLHHGRDATASYGSIDMKFQNDTPAPIYIRASTSGGLLHFTLWGKRTPGREVTLVRGKEVNLGSPVETHSDPHLSAGRRIVEERGSPGISVTWTRIIKDNGQVVKREAFHSHYTAFPTVVAVGTRARAKPTPKPTSVPPGTTPQTPSGGTPSVTPVKAPGQ